MDRHERRQQRMRGAGAASVQENFGFSFAGLGPKVPAKPVLRQTPTPSRNTPRASAQRSTSGSKDRHIPPRPSTATPSLGKRKRSSPRVEPAIDDGEPDDLSPDRADYVHSVERSRRVVGTVSPTYDAVENEPDELSVLELERGQSAFKGVSPVAATEKTPIVDGTGNMTAGATVESLRRSISTDVPPNTPGLLPLRPRVSSASHTGPQLTTPNVAQDTDDSEDELSPPKTLSTARVLASRPQMQSSVENEVLSIQDVDELSPPALTRKVQPFAPAPARAGKPRRVALDEDEQVNATPTASGLRRKQTNLAPPVQAEAGEDAPDEISPDSTRTGQHSPHAVRREVRLSNSASADDSDTYEPEVEEQSLAKKPRQARSAKPTGDDMRRKLPKFGGPKRPISVMRIKGSTVRGITVADTTRTILEQNVDHRVSRMAEKLQRTQDSSRRKQIRTEVNLILAFKESLNEKLLDLQDANDTLSAGFQRRKVLKGKNVERRRRILALQNSRHDIALDLDDEQAAFDIDKERTEVANKLSANMFEIQAAIKSGRERARRQGREEEGPSVPLGMLLESIGRSVGSAGGGLLAGMTDFNRGLERAAGWLEGRA